MNNSYQLDKLIDSGEVKYKYIENLVQTHTNLLINMNESLRNEKSEISIGIYKNLETIKILFNKMNKIDLENKDKYKESRIEFITNALSELKEIVNEQFK